jgi:hypothetical protein
VSFLTFLKENAQNQKARDALEDETSTPFEAYLWLVQDEGVAEGEGDDLLERFALATFYYSLRGPDWIRSDKWMSGESICDWFGVECAEKTLNVKTTSSLHDLVTLDLPNNFLQGALPPELALLDNLEFLDLSNNNIGGPLGPVLGGISSMGRFG